jgi:hypothetical protein
MVFLIFKKKYELQNKEKRKKTMHLKENFGNFQRRKIKRKLNSKDRVL